VVSGGPQATFTGQVAWRATVPAQSPLAETRVSMGPGRHVVSYPLRDGSMMNLVAVEERAAWAEEGWQQSGDPEQLRAVFGDFGGPVGPLLDRVTQVGVWGLFRHPVAERWVRGNVALLGDAAHPTLPFLAQGANLALEDAWVLAQCLCNGTVQSEYQRLRRGRAVRVIDAAGRNARKYHLREGPVRSAAHFALGLGSRLAPGQMIRQFEWIYGHDVTQP
ncbi:FAD-dependent monooxygenase, partial [Roseobacter sp.]